MQEAHTTQRNTQEPIFLTLFPAHYGVQIAVVLACSERYGWFPTHVLLHPERYEVCEQRELFIPYPQEGVQDAMALYQVFASKEEEQRVLHLPPLAAPPIHVVRVGICADPALKWYQIKCLCTPS